MKIVARHKTAPLVALSDGSVIDTENLEVIGTGDVSGAKWEFQVGDMQLDPRWAEIAQADQASLSVTKKKANSGERTFRAPTAVKQALTDAGVESPLTDGAGLTLTELDTLFDHESLPDTAFEWICQTLNKHEHNPDAEAEASLFEAAEPELDYSEIDAAMDGVQSSDDSPLPDDVVTAAAEAPDTEPEIADADDQGAVASPPPGKFSKVVYFAVVQQDDTESVQDLIALVQTPQGAADAFSYQGQKKGWKENAKLIQELQSPAPPPIKQLADWQTNAVLEQINMSDADGDLPDDAEPEQPPPAPVQASAFELVEAGVIWGPDNRQILSIVAGSHSNAKWGGNAERLRQYWEHGEGAAKIRWAPNSGAWRRCVRHLSKYLGPRAKGYCAIRMHHVLGIWPGSKANGGHGGHRAFSLEEAPILVAAAPRAYKRWPAGASGGQGGQFAPGPARNSGQATQAQHDAAAKQLATALMNKTMVQQQTDLKELTNDDLKRLTAYMYSFKSSDPKVVAARIRLANEMAHRGYDVKDFGALGGGTGSNKDKGKAIGPSSVGAPAAKKTPAVKTHAPAKAPGTPTDGGVKNTYSVNDMSKFRQGSALDLSGLSSAEKDKLSQLGWGQATDDNRQAVYPPTSPPSMSTDGLTKSTINNLVNAGWVVAMDKNEILPANVPKAQP